MKVRCLNRSQKAFTLIELMIVVALIGVLASLAIPSFRTYQMKSKRAEAFGNLATLAQTQKSYFAEFSGCLLYTSPSPRDRTRSRMPSSA